MTRLSNAPLPFLVALLVLAFAGCSGGEDPKPKPPGDADPAQAVLAKLAQADQADGTEDKVVSQCAACSLGMAGSEEHALAVRGYTMHFCSAECRTSYAGDPDAALGKLKIQ